MKTKHEGITTCIKHLAFSGLSRGTARIKSSCNLIGNRFEMPNVSYTQPLCAILRQTTDIQDNISIFSTEYIETKISPV